MFENPRRGREARNFTTNVPKILVLKSSSEQIFSRKLPLGAPDDTNKRRGTWRRWALSQNLIRVLSKSQNWLAGPWPDRSFWKWNRVFPRAFQKLLVMKNNFLRACYLGFDWSGWIAFIKSEILITKRMAGLVSSDKCRALATLY